MASSTTSPKTATPQLMKKVKFHQHSQGGLTSVTYTESSSPTFYNHWSQGLLPPSIRQYINDKFTLSDQRFYSLVTLIVQLILEVSLSTFYLILLFIAHPDSIHFARTVDFSFLFVYSGTNYMRKILITSYFIIIIPSLTFLVFSSCVLIRTSSPTESITSKSNSSGKSTSSNSITHTWLITLAIYLVIKVVTFIFQHTVNDLLFGYHRFTLTLWIFFIVIDVLILMIIYPNIHENFDDTDKLNDQDQYERANSNDDEDDYGSPSLSDRDDSAGSESTKRPRSSNSDINVRPSPEASSISTSIFSYKSERVVAIPMELKGITSSASTDLPPPRCSTQTPV